MSDITPAHNPSGNIVPFIYDGAAVRTVVIDGAPWFVAADIARVLEYRMASDMTRRLDDSDKGYAKVRTPGGDQDMAVISESGLYDATFRSNSEGAKPFRRWVTGEVLPTIRKTGGAYIAPSSQAELDLTNPDTALDKLIEVANIAKAERARRIALEEKVEADRPMVERVKRHANGTGMMTRTQFFRDLKSWAQAERGVVVKRDDVNAFLSTRKLGLFVRGNRSDEGQATAWAIEKGYADNKPGTADNGRNFVTGKLTPRGQEYAWERIFRYIDANGTLVLPREVEAA